MERRGHVALFVVTVAVVALVGGAAHAKKKRAPAKAPKAALTCKVDADCALTRMDDGQCCPMLCQPRAVAKASAEALEKYAATCEKPGNAKLCPAPACAPPRFTLEAACVSAKCETRAAAGGSRD
jgi:hypothetical protein